MASVTLSSIWQCAHTTATGKCLTVLVFQRVERVKQLKKVPELCLCKHMKRTIPKSTFP